jgi:drug/metabolite transporter (DMT)-like permease
MLVSDRAAGVALGLLAALVGGSWQVMTRQSASTTLAPQDLVILRYGIPALLLAPFWWRSGLRPAGVPAWRLALIVGGAGLPFGALAIGGAALAPAAHMGVLMAGAGPLFTAALAMLLWRERPGRIRSAGLGLMALAVALLGAGTLAGWQPAHATGDAMFLLAAALWTVFALALRGSGLGPWQAAALVNVWSALGVAAWVLARGGTTLLQAPLPHLMQQALWQGVLAGVVGLWAFNAAVARLGAPGAAAFGALAPAVSALGGWCWLGEALGPLQLGAVVAAVLGVLLASTPGPLGPVERRGPAAAPSSPREPV